MPPLDRPQSQSENSHEMAAVMRRLDAIEAKVDSILTLLSVLNEEVMSELSDLQADVARETDLDKSVVTLLSGLAAKLQDAIASGNKQALVDLHTQMTSNASALAAAVAANTPAESDQGSQGQDTTQQQGSVQASTRATKTVAP